MHPVEQRIVELRRQARGIIFWHGLYRALAVALAALILAGIVDFLVRLEDHGLRLMLSLGVVAAIVFFGWRWLLGLSQSRWTTVQVAQRVEGHYPDLAGRVSSAISFLGLATNDPVGGSPALRAAVVEQAQSDLSGLDLRQILDSHSARRTGRWLLIFGILALALAALFPRWMMVGLARLCQPLAGPRWPQVHQLVVKEAPERIAVGDPFEISVIDQQGRLPSEVRLHWRFADAASSEVEPMRKLDDAMIARKEGIVRNFAYRVEGGDDQSMPWRNVEVIEPAKVEELAVRVHPPDYTGWPVAEAPRGFHALAGSRIELSGAASKPLSSAEVAVEDGATVPLVVNENRFQLSPDTSFPLVAVRSQNYWLRLTDTLQVNGGAGQRWEMRVATDSPPQVTLEEPAGDLYVTPQGKVDLLVVVKDDIAIRDVALAIQKFDEAGKATDKKPVSLWQGPQHAPLLDQPVEPGTQELDTQRLEQAWKLSEYELRPGMQITITAVASDYKPQIGNSSPRRLHVVSAAELEQRLAQRQAGIAGELERALQLQQDVRARAEELGIQWERVPTLRRQDLDQAQAVQLAQKQVARTLSGQGEGIPQAVRSMLADLENNRIDNPAMRRQLEGVQSELSRLGRDELKPVDSELNQLVKESQAELGATGDQQQAVPTPNSLKASLAKATRGQANVVQSLEKMLSQLQDAGSARRFAQELGDIRQAQQGLANDLKQQSASTLGKEAAQLSPQEQADLDKQSSREQSLAQKLERTLEQMRSAAQTAEAEDPLAAAAFKETTDLAGQQGVSGAMRTSADEVRRNQLGQAKQKQEEVLRNLDEMLDTLSNRREHELERLADKLREAEQELSQMRGQQKERAEQLSKNRGANGEAGDPAEQQRQLERLVKQQQQSREQTQRLAKRLERLTADRAASKARAAAQQIGASGEQSDAGNQEGGAEQAREAQAQLQETQREVARRRKQVEAQLAEETVRQMDSLLVGLRDRQDHVLHDTSELEMERAKQGSLKRTQFVQVSQLAGEERTLARETSELVKKLVDKEVFQWTLREAAREMDDASEKLTARSLGKPTQKAQTIARNRIVMTLEALKRSQQQAKAQTPEQPGGEPPDGQGGGEQAAQSRRKALNPAEIKLLSLMQEDLNRRFGELVEQKSDPEQPSLRQSLAEELGKLAEMTERLARATEEPPDDQDFPELDLQPKKGEGKP
jgi:hypothetical protein